MDESLECTKCGKDNFWLFATKVRCSNCFHEIDFIDMDKEYTEKEND